MVMCDRRENQSHQAPPPELFQEPTLNLQGYFLYIQIIKSQSQSFKTCQASNPKTRKVARTHKSRPRRFLSGKLRHFRPSSKWLRVFWISVPQPIFSIPCREEKHQHGQHGGNRVSLKRTKRKTECRK